MTFNQIIQEEANENQLEAPNPANENYVPTGQLIKYQNKGYPEGNIDSCCICKEGGKLICCDDCPSSFHSECLGYVSQKQCPRGKWKCYFCKVARYGAEFTQRKAPGEEAHCL